MVKNIDVCSPSDDHGLYAKAGPAYSTNEIANVMTDIQYTAHAYLARCPAMVHDRRRSLLALISSLSP